MKKALASFVKQPWNRQSRLAGSDVSDAFVSFNGSINTHGKEEPTGEPADPDPKEQFPGSRFGIKELVAGTSPAVE